MGRRRDVLARFLFVPDVIAGRHHVDAPFEQRLADVTRDTEPIGRVFRVRDDEVDAVMLDETTESPVYEVAPGASDNVADEQDVHAVVSVMAMRCERPRR